MPSLLSQTGVRGSERWTTRRFGRKPKPSLHQIKEALARKQTGEAMADIGRSYNVSHSTVSLLA